MPNMLQLLEDLSDWVSKDGSP